MALIFEGKVVSLDPRKFNGKNGEFCITTAYCLDGGARPIPVKFGDRVTVPKVGEKISQPVYIRSYQTKGGRSGYDLVAYDPEARK